MPDMPPPVFVPVPPAPPATQSNTPWYQDKGVYAMLLSPVLFFLSHFLGIQLDSTLCAAFLIPIVTFIVAHKAKSGAVLVAEINARTAAPQSPKTPQAAADALSGLLAPK